jgi:hypothetical protein
MGGIGTAAMLILLVALIAGAFRGK